MRVGQGNVGTGRATVPALAGSVALLAGCDGGGAPSLIVSSAYFPAWMFCALFGIAGAIGTRAAMVAWGLSDRLPFQTAVCTAAGIILAVALWASWFGG